VADTPSRSAAQRAVANALGLPPDDEELNSVDQMLKDNSAQTPIAWIRGMCKERRPRATAQRCACRQLGNAIEGRRSRSPQMPARCHQRSPRRPVRRLQRGCEGRLL